MELTYAEIRMDERDPKARRRKTGAQSTRRRFVDRESIRVVVSLTHFGYCPVGDGVGGEGDREDASRVNPRVHTFTRLPAQFHFPRWYDESTFHRPGLMSSGNALSAM